MLREQQNAPDTGTLTTPAPTSTVAQARLTKLLKETERLQIEIENARLQQEVMKGKLVPIEEATEVYGRPHRAVQQELQTMPKTMAPKLYNQPQRAIEEALAEWCDRLSSHIRESI
jgi:hypothetical protein